MIDMERNSIKALILCEGETDQILIGSYMEGTGNWKYVMEGMKEFPGEKILCYRKQNGQRIGIWKAGGCSFRDIVSKVAYRDYHDPIIENLIVVTDNDNIDESSARIQSIADTLKKQLKTHKIKGEDIDNQWAKISFSNDFGSYDLNVYCLLVPINDIGALETFMMNAISEKSDEKAEVIDQVKAFVKDFKSERYLRHRREKIKAELGIALSIFSPDRIFTTMKEIIDDVEWSELATAHEQFKVLDEMN